LENDESSVTRIAVLAETLRGEAADSEKFLELVAKLLQDVLPHHTVVQRAGGLFAGRRPVRVLEVTMGEHRYRVEHARPGLLEARRMKVVRDITLSTEQRSIGQWIDEVTAALAEAAQQSIDASAALRKFLSG